MPEYLISKQGSNYLVYRDRRPFNPEIGYSSLMPVLASIITSGDDLGSVVVRLGQEVSSEKDAQAFKMLFRHIQSVLSAEARLSKLEDELLAFDPEMTVEALIDHLRLAGLLGESPHNIFKQNIR